MGIATGLVQYSRGWSGCWLMWPLLTGLVFILGSCGSGADREPIVRIMSYNTQNMFDDHPDGGEYPEFQPGGGGGWNRTLYRTRLERLATVIRDQAKMPDIVVLQEIETQKVLEDLCRDFLPSGFYPLRILQADPGSIHIGLLSRLPLVSRRSHQIWLDGESGRSIWELYFNLPGQPVPQAGFNPAEFQGFVLFANHWKSKSGGEAETEAMRILTARGLRQRSEDLVRQYPHLALLACGDFNEILHTAGEPVTKVNPRGRTHRLPLLHLQTGAVGTPLVALGWSCETAGRDSVGRIRAALPIAAWTDRAATTSAWYSPWNPDGTDDAGRTGSYRYRGKWEAIDHFLIGAGWVDHPVWAIQSFQVIGNPELLDEQGNPRRWDARTKTGISDHLPLLLTVRKTLP